MAVRLAGANRLSQLEAHSLLLHLDPDESLVAVEHAAFVRAVAKLRTALADAQRRSIPKGLDARPDYLPTMYEE